MGMLHVTKNLTFIKYYISNMSTLVTKALAELLSRCDASEGCALF